MVKKSLLIIKSSPGGLGNVEGFLRNRDWIIKSTTNLKEALIFLVQQQPAFVMISIDHPNKKVRNLPKILTQAFPVCVIAFSEDTSAATYGLLNACPTEYILYPPVTGPAVERTVNKYYKDMQTRGLTPHQVRSTDDGTQDGVIAIKGDGSFNPANAQNILAQMLAGDEPSATMTGPGLKKSGFVTQGMGQAPLHGSMFAPQPKSTQGGMYAPLAKNPYGTWVPTGNPFQQRPRRTPEEIEADPRATKNDSVILRGTKQALESACNVTSFQESAPLQQATNVACIVVESSRFSGYLITAMAKNKHIDSAFMEKVQTRLFRFLKENGEDIKESERMDLQIKQVPFEDWALDCAEFLRKSLHEGNEVAMAFFPCNNVQTRYGDSPAEEMASIKLEEMAGNVAVEFNVYIYLPRNNKYVLYTPRGGVFYNVQKERLKNQGISQLHILKGDLQDLDKYKAQNFLNEKIQEFEEKVSAKETA
ncbi:hypothetical protein [Bdellovibrio bacteriovorus]|uniref:hypothetical protein n=1 Tax=Bdellovibrio bacteriovorus TaxID=959 RepID=UPI0035A6854F